MVSAVEPEQQDILVQIVEAQRKLPRTGRRHFMLSQTLQSSHLVHPELSLEVFKGDLDALEMAGLIYIAAYGSRHGTPNYEISPQGYDYYAELKSQRDQPLEQVEEDITRFLASDEFIRNHSTAAAKWREAAEHLWSGDPERQLTSIGHLCREALQEFADGLVARYGPPDASAEKAKDINRIAAVLNQQKQAIGEGNVNFLKAAADYLDALLEYWRKVNGITQRQEHGGQKEGRPLTWEDARRVVFQTAIVMYEVARTLR